MIELDIIYMVTDKLDIEQNIPVFKQDSVLPSDVVVSSLLIILVIAFVFFIVVKKYKKSLISTLTPMFKTLNIEGGEVKFKKRQLWISKNTCIYEIESNGQLYILAESTVNVSMIRCDKEKNANLALNQA